MDKISIFYSDELNAFNLSQDIEQGFRTAGYEDSIERQPLYAFHPSALLKSRAIIIVITTQFHGQSLPQDVSFFRYLEQIPVVGQWCKFTVFGVDNAMNDYAFHSFKRLLSLARSKGWASLCDPCLGDSQDPYTLLCQLDDWLLGDLLPAFQLSVGPRDSADDEDEEEPLSPWTLTSPLKSCLPQESVGSQPSLLSVVRKLPPRRDFHEFTVTHNDGGRLNLACADPSVAGKCRVLEVWPINNGDEVDEFLGDLKNAQIPKLQLELDPSHKRSFMDGLSIEYIFKNLLDLQAAPSRAVLHQISNFFEGKYRTKLRELAQFTKPAVVAYCDYITDYRRSILEILLDFRSGIVCDTEVALVKFLIFQLPLIHTRSYFVASHAKWPSFVATRLQLNRLFRSESPTSIARLASKLAPELDPDSVPGVSLCFERVIWPTKSPNRKVEGSCSKYFSALSSGDTVIASVTQLDDILCKSRPNLLLCYDNGFYFAQAAAFEAIVENLQVTICAAPPVSIPKSQIADLLFLSSSFPDNVRFIVAEPATPVAGTNLARLLEAQGDALLKGDAEFQVIVTAVGFATAGRPSQLVESLEDLFQESRYRLSFVKRV